jgi:hypothetical protein
MAEDPAFMHELFEAHTQLIIDLYEGMKRWYTKVDGQRGSTLGGGPPEFVGA